jgi:hypothetical protein
MEFARAGSRQQGRARVSKFVHGNKAARPLAGLFRIEQEKSPIVKYFLRR